MGGSAKRVGTCVLLLLAVGAAMALAAGTAEGTKAAPSGQPVVVTLLNCVTEKPERIEFFEQASAKYQQTHPNVRIEMTKTSFTDVNTQVLTAIAAGTPYDLFTTYNMNLWVAKGIALNLAPFLNADGGAWKNELYEQVLEAITYPSGDAYMIPLWIDALPFLYHKEIFAKLGLQPPANAWELFAACDALKEKGYIPFQVHGSMKSSLLTVFGWQFAAKFGVKPYDVVQGKVPFTDPWYLDALRFFKEMYDRGYLPANFWSVSGTEGRMAYSTGKIAMRFGLFWDVDTQKDMGMPYENQGVAAFPNVTGAPGLKLIKPMNLTGIMISKDSKVPDAAAGFLRYLTNTENQDQMSYRYFGHYPNGMPAVNKGVKLSEYARKYIDDLAKGISTPYSIGDFSLKYEDTLSQQLPLLMQGKISVEQCAAEIEKLRTAK